jgi:hypothetical protein
MLRMPAFYRLGMKLLVLRNTLTKSHDLRFIVNNLFDFAGRRNVSDEQEAGICSEIERRYSHEISLSISF